MKRVDSLLGRLFLMGAVTLCLSGRVTASDVECPPTYGTQGLSGQSTVKAKIVFVYFPSAPSGMDSTLLSWNGWLKTELHDWVNVMSRGQQDLQVGIMKRLGADSTKAWRASNPVSHYQGSFSGFAELNREIMLKIHSTYQAASVDTCWKNVNMVFMIHYENPFSSSGQGGIGCLGLKNYTANDVPGFNECGDCNASTAPSGCVKRGETQRLFYGGADNDFTGSSVNHRVAGGAAHEYGHVLLDRLHSPKSGNPPSGSENPGSCIAQNQWGLPYVNMGKYDIMRGSGNLSWSHFGAAPLHPFWLKQPDPNSSSLAWVPEEVITTDTRGLHVPQIRGSQGKSYRINTANSQQYFVFANYQGAASSVFDERLGGTGLLVWHMLHTGAAPIDALGAWDLESARGRRQTSYGFLDSLESNWCYIGDGKDFFNNTSGAGGQNFSVTTNPNTNLWPGTNHNATQTVRTSIALENIRQDTASGSTDIIVDVFVSPKQYVSAPNGAEVKPAGEALSITWDTRPYSNIYKVDVALSTDGGSNYSTLAPNEANDGTFGFTPSVLSTQCRARVTSYDSLTSAGDQSDANFTVWGVVEDGSSPSHSNLQVVAGPKLRLDVAWNTSISTSSGDQVTFYNAATGGSSFAGTAVGSLTYGTSHAGTWEVNTSGAGDWWYTVTSTAPNSTTHTSSTRKNVYTDIRQLVSSPNGGEVRPVNQSTAITWLKRDQAGITSVAIGVSTNGGSSYETVEPTASNTGSHPYTPTELGTQYRVRVTSTDGSASVADASDANFTVWGISSIAHSNVIALEDSFQVTITWNTNVATTNGADAVKLYNSQSGGSPMTPVVANYSTSNGGLTHTAVCRFTPCLAHHQYYYEASSSLSSATVASARTTSTKFALAACIDPL